MKFITDFLNSGTVKQQNRKKLGALLICITAALLAVALIVLMIFSIANAIKNRGAEEESEDTGVKIPSGYTTTIFPDGQSSSGLLLLIDEAHPYVGTAPTVQSTPRTEYRPTVDGTTEGTPIYIVNGYDSISFTAETLTSFNKMMVDFYAAKSGEGYQAKAICIEPATSVEELSASTKAVLASGTAMILVDQYSTESIYDAEAQTGRGVYAWLYENAAQYGFVRASEAEGEENIFRYVGVAHASYMATKDMALADYIAHIQKKTNVRSQLSISVTGADGKAIKYGVYYIAPGEEQIVPEAGAFLYTVSGDNAGGYIVTVNKTTKVDAETTPAA